jgi:hypothetical protein
VLRWLADENFNNDILRALFRANRDIDIVRAQDVGLTGATDESVLAWTADQDRVLLTHDVSTVTAHAYRRVMKGERMPGETVLDECFGLCASASSWTRPAFAWRATITPLSALLPD